MVSAVNVCVILLGSGVIPVTCVISGVYWQVGGLDMIPGVGYQRENVGKD